MKELVFTIMRERDGRQLRQIPLRVILPHQQQALTNHHQTLGRLEERGGLSAKEALHVLLDLRYGYNDESQRIQNLTQNEADAELRQVVKARYMKMVADEQAAKGEVPCDHPDPPKEITGAEGARTCKKCGAFFIL